MIRIPAYALVVCLTSLVCSCARRPNVLLVTFDTTRADHVGYACGRRDLTPNIDALARKGTWFSKCTASAPLTMPAHTSLLTGLYPYRHGVRDNGSFRLSAQPALLTESLGRAGYATHAVVSSFVLDHRFGLSRGFDQYDDDLSSGRFGEDDTELREIPAQVTADKAIRWLERAPVNRPFFLWLHFFDPHFEYRPPADVAALFPGDPYSGEIRYADRELGRVLDVLRRSGLLENTLVVFTADHGESLGEHGERSHALFVYGATIRVPLLMAGLGVPAHGRVDALVRSVDVMPTVLSLLSLPEPADLDGASVRPLWEGEGRDDHRVAYFESYFPRTNLGFAELRGLEDGRFKVIQAPRPEVYGLDSDPEEKENIARGELPVEARTLLAKVQSLPEGTQTFANSDADALSRLQSLGYLPAGRTADSAAALRDPKDAAESFDAIMAAREQRLAGHTSEAIAALERLTAREERNILALSTLASAYAGVGRFDFARTTWEKILRLEPRLSGAALEAARLAFRAHDLGRAERFFRHVLVLEPDDADVQTELGLVLVAQNRLQEAELLLRRALAREPNGSRAPLALADCLSRANRLAEAENVLRSARKSASESQGLAYALALILEKQGKRAEAIDAYRDAVRLDPKHAMSWNNLGSMLTSLGRRDEALGCYEKSHALDPSLVEAAYNLGVLRFWRGEFPAALVALDDAKRANPALIQVDFLRVRTLQALGRSSEERALMRRLERRPPLEWLSFAEIELQMGRRDAAREDLAAAVRKGGDAIRRRAAGSVPLRELLRSI